MKRAIHDARAANATRVVSYEVAHRVAHGARMGIAHEGGAGERCDGQQSGRT